MGLRNKLEARWQNGEGLREGGGWEAAAFVLGSTSVFEVALLSSSQLLSILTFIDLSKL